MRVPVLCNCIDALANGLVLTNGAASGVSGVSGVVGAPPSGIFGSLEAASGAAADLMEGTRANGFGFAEPTRAAAAGSPWDTTESAATTRFVCDTIVADVSATGLIDWARANGLGFAEPVRTAVVGMVGSAATGATGATGTDAGWAFGGDGITADMSAAGLIDKTRANGFGFADATRAAVGVVGATGAETRARGVTTMALAATGVCRGDAIDTGASTAGLMDGARANGLGLRDTTRNTEAAADGGAAAVTA